MKTEHHSPSPGLSAIVAGVFALVLQGCALPRSAPLLHEVTSANKSGQIELVPITADLTAATRDATQASFPEAFLETKVVDYERLAPGDGVTVNIFERDGLNVYPPGPNGASSLSEMTVSGAGAIDIPYVGAVQVVGLTPAEARNAILRRLRGIVIATDVNVSQTTQRGQSVTVQGDLTKSGVYPIGQNMLHLSGLLGLASPDQTNPEEVAVTVRRGGLTGMVRLSDVYHDPAQDIALRPGDSVVVNAIDEHLTVIGAVAAQGRVKLTKRNYTVLDALADARGLSDANAYPKAVFLMRRRSDPQVVAAAAPPIVYQFDLRQPAQVLLASAFVVHDGDTLYVSDSVFTQVEKVLSAFSATLGTARSVSSISQ